MFHSFQWCSQPHCLPTPPKVSNRCENTAKPQVPVLVYASLIGVRKNNAEFTKMLPLAEGSVAEDGPAWQRPDMGRKSKNAPFAGDCKEAQPSHWSGYRWETGCTCATLARAASSKATGRIPSLSLRQVMRNSVLFIYSLTFRVVVGYPDAVENGGDRQPDVRVKTWPLHAKSPGSNPSLATYTYLCDLTASCFIDKILRSGNLWEKLSFSFPV